MFGAKISQVWRHTDLCLSLLLAVPFVFCIFGGFGALMSRHVKSYTGSFTLDQLRSNTLLLQILCFMHYIAELVLNMFCSLIIALISLDVCWTISRNAVPFDVTLYHFTPSCVRGLRLHRLNVCQAISRKAVLFDITLYNFTKYCAISSGADSFDITLNCFARLCAISCSAISSYPVSIVTMLCHFM